ncbi:Non-specific lipid transfer protein GPI-anchored 16 [Linum perenne]
MEAARLNLSTMWILSITTILIVTAVDAQQTISTPCTASMITSFSPCLNFITGSTNNGASPTAMCCDALKGLVSSSMECACLLVTANVPLQLPRPVSVSLPRACKMGVPLQCKASGSPLPAPGPAVLGGPPAPSSPQGSKAIADAPAPDSTVVFPLSPAIPPESDDPTSTTPTESTGPLVNKSVSYTVRSIVMMTVYRSVPFEVEMGWKAAEKLIRHWKILRGDNVMVIRGKDKGETGVIKRAESCYC